MMLESSHFKTEDQIIYCVTYADNNSKDILKEIDVVDDVTDEEWGKTEIVNHYKILCSLFSPFFLFN